MALDPNWKYLLSSTPVPGADSPSGVAVDATPLLQPIEPTTTTRRAPSRSRTTAVAEADLPLTSYTDTGSPYDMHGLVTSGLATPEQIEAYVSTHGGNLPSFRRDPTGSIYTTNDAVAEMFGIPMGTNLSIAGTGSPVGSVFVPEDLAQQLPENTLAARGQLADFYNNLGITSAMQGFDSSNLGDVSVAQRFMDWWGGGGAPFPNVTGGYSEAWDDLLGGQMGFPAPWEYQTPYGEAAYMPGLFGTSYFTSQYKPGGENYNPGLFATQVNIDQLQKIIGGEADASSLWGPLSGWIPPWLLREAGIGPEQIYGGDFSLGQTTADPGLREWWEQFSEGGEGGGGGGPQPTGGQGGGEGGTGFLPNPFPLPGGGTGADLPPSLWPTDPFGPGGGFPGFPGFPGGGFPEFPGGGFPGGPGGYAPGSSPDEFLAYGAGDINYLRSLVEQSGLPINTLPAWQAMTEAQQRSLDRNYANMMETFNTGGTRFSSPFAQASVDYWTQANRDQNALLAQMQMQALEAARGRQAAGAQTLGQLGYGGAQQLSSQNFQALMEQMRQAYGAAQGLFGAGQGAAGQLAGLGAQGAQSMQDAATQAAMALFGGSMQGAQSLFGAEIAAAMEAARQQAMFDQLGLQTAGNLSNIWRQNLLTGQQLGMGQYSLMQDQLDRLYGEYLRTIPQNNPLLPYMYGMSQAFPPTSFPQYAPSPWGGVGGYAGGLLGQILPAIFGGGGGGGSTITLQAPPTTGGYWGLPGYSPF